MIYLPKRINVGFQNRSGTYTGKLAYVIYYDDKGKLRKETSWNGWRDKTIPNEEYDNTPTDGFVLNKKVGDYSNDWGGHRHAYCRIYDPRGFEFEITIENLLWILECCDCIKGKGLEGEFVYGWDGKDLLLVPVNSADYQENLEKTKKKESIGRLKAKDLVIGKDYETADGKKLTYLGKYTRYYPGSPVMQCDINLHWFMEHYKKSDGSNGMSIHIQKSVPNNIISISEELNPKYHEYYTKIMTIPEGYAFYSYEKPYGRTEKVYFTEEELREYINNNIKENERFYFYTDNKDPYRVFYIKRNGNLIQCESRYWSRTMENISISDIIRRYEPYYCIEYFKDGEEIRRLYED